ncbi:MAG: hypothetical protein Kow00124_13890 [Anaerolineae bacterium]
MRGKLEHFGGTQILSLVSLARKTGQLAVMRADTGARLVFKEGKLIFASMGEHDGSLASVLARDGRITKEQAAALAKHALKTGDKQLGLLLIQKGYVSRADIVQSIKRHALNVVRQFASWNEGEWAFDPNTQPDTDRITVPLDLENVIIEIARAQKRDEQLELEIPSLDVGLRFAEKPKVKVQDLQLSQDEWAVIHYIKPENTIRMIANRLNMSDRQIRRIVGSLREAGLVELVAERPRPPQRPEERHLKRTTVHRLIDYFQKI